MNYGTLTNQIYSETKQSFPNVGDGATLIFWSDRHAYTVVAVGNKYVLVTRDLVKQTDSNFENGPQEYSYSTDVEAVPQKAMLRKDGNYYLGGHVLKIGFRDEFYDYSF